MRGKDNRAGKQPNVFVEQNVVILFDDIIVSTAGPILSVQFCDRVHDQASSGDVRNYGVALSQKGVRIKSIGSMGKAKRGVVIG
ncbi:hypothetical protein V6N11_049703 [Hibiscus sabdariffa]|uniref:Uncharacterized protein n=1 Tax=Hibiscus sabdariffa TaxID=183260 RepID=A0ABR2A7V6_9ROSI